MYCCIQDLCSGYIYLFLIGSMYGIFAYIIYTYIWLIFTVNVGKYTIHGSYGIYHIYLVRESTIRIDVFMGSANIYGSAVPNGSGPWDCQALPRSKVVVWHFLKG